jgi:two-component system C4-dicarboxylate transport sensor histidine kinase DctB
MPHPARCGEPAIGSPARFSRRAGCSTCLRVRTRLVLGLLVLALAALAAWGVGGVVERRARAALLAETLTDARLRKALLDSEVARFRLLPLALADDRDVLAAMAKRVGAARALDVKLERLARATGAAAIYAVAPGGRAIAASNWRGPVSFVGNDYAFRGYYRDALARGRAEQFALGTVSHRPGLYLAHRSGGAGVVVVKLEFDRIEAAWRAAGGETYVTGANGVVLLASRAGWRFAATRALSPAAAARFRTQTQVGGRVLPALPVRVDGAWVRVAGERGRRAHVALPPDAGGWRLHLLMPARRVAALVQTARAAAAAAVLLLALAGWRVRARGRRRAARTRELEAAVAERTAALRREMEERQSLEARAATLREGLRQANRLATLGQVTASVAHETAQPVAAIRTYAANARTLLARGDTARVGENLSAIARLTERIGAVTAGLRDFARKGAGAIGPVPLAEVVDGALLILSDRLRGVDLERPAIPPDLMVRGGRVRLEQVLVNLIGNALEAVAGTPAPRIALRCDAAGNRVGLEVADNGPGVAPDIAARLFTPFVTSRATGLGLGLVIAHDIVAEFGGTLALLPSTTGARFRIVLVRA